MKSAFLVGAAALLCCTIASADPAVDDARSKIAAQFKIPADAISPSPIPGLYEIRHHHQFGYVSADGRYLLEGDLVDIKTGEQITEQRRRDDRRAALKALGESNYIEFAPQPPLKTNYVVTVFTDVDCGYCRLLHSKIAAYNAKGIEIRYAFFPRSGPDTESWYKAEAVWCSSDRKASLTKAKLGEKIESKACTNPVAREYELGRELGVNATPAMILPSGELVLGMAMPDELLEHLQEADKPAAAVLN